MKCIDFVFNIGDGGKTIPYDGNVKVEDCESGIEGPCYKNIQ